MVGSVLFSVGEHIGCGNIELKRDVVSTNSFYVFIKANAGYIISGCR